MNRTKGEVDLPAKKHAPLVRFDALRFVLALFFVVYAYVAGRGLLPLPDEPPRIKFLEVFCASLAMVIAYHALVSRARAFPLLVCGFLMIAHQQLAGRVRFLEMMLESHRVEQLLQYGLGIVFLVLLSPRALRMFQQPIGAQLENRPLLVRKGIPF